ncbi:signaling protein YkoW [Paenibacillus algicola]|uniref:Signaling protein YkoW n=2 Tax=Paenibacillus algicola TaxID=2565926 RepID=A0A4P8XIP3_9BACL|nr:signaling protein YkoW [Paenibacillus algicola]
MNHSMDHSWQGSYDTALVVFSYIVAVVASYTVLGFVVRISKSSGWQRWGWLLFGSIAMGMGVWSMHFVGMLAFSLPVPIAYDLLTVLLSVVVVILASFLALFIVGRGTIGRKKLVAGGLLLASGIVAMHYIGMAAMQIHITYKPLLFAASILIAVVASITALWLSLYFGSKHKGQESIKKLASGLIMGAAVVGMHYTGMYAAEFHPGVAVNESGVILDQKLLAYLIAGATLMTLGLSLFGIYISNRFSSKESELEVSEKWYKSLFDNNQDGIISVDLDYRIIEYNDAVCRLTGLDGDWLRRQTIDQIFSFIAEEEQEKTRMKFLASLQGVIQRYETAIYHQDGRRVELSVINIPVKLNEEVVGNYIIARDVTEDKRSKEKIQHQAHHDELTGLPNRRRFHQILNEKIQEKNTPFAVMVLDIDRFKMINDSMGHTYGDMFLQEVSRRIQVALKDNHVTLSRMGGDEFTLLSHAEFDQEHVAVMAQDIIRMISQPYRLKDTDFYVTASIGIAVYPMDGDNAVQLLKNADTAMYEVKKNGKNGYRLYSRELNEQLREKMELEADLRRAFEREEFMLCYQPQIRSSDSKMIGIEALVRWKHATRGIVSPGVFIPIAEETGLIHELGSWVLREACRQMKEWHTAGGPLIPVSVNLSSQQFHQENLAEFIISILDETGLPPQYLELEITESMMMDPTVSTGILHSLTEHGIRISLDDFGTGYSSLSYLKHLPIQKLKIDRSFIRDIASNANDKAIVATIIAMAQHLNMDVVAEGIETQEQLDILTESDCRKIQGYFYSRPLPAWDVEQGFFVPQREMPSKA